MYLQKIIDNIEHYADILAIPFFILASYYFITKPNKSIIEQLLTLFVVVGAIADILFTIKFTYRNRI
jgi:hypothetical protein